MTTYDELVVAATVGVGQRPLTITGLPGPAGTHTAVLDDDPAGAVLDAAALLDAARRAAGLSPVPTELPEPAVPDRATPLSEAGTRIVGEVLVDSDTALLVDLLAATARAGRRLPPTVLPAALDLAARDRSTRTVVAAVLGERGRWLAAQRPDWHRVADDLPAPVDDDPQVWELGRAAERRAWLLARRGTDPDLARDLLASGWARESGDDRVALLATFATGLGPADEPFLEAALDDRKADVRRSAVHLLRGLPDSAFVARAEGRVASVLRVERRGLRRGIAVTEPDEPDEAALRDGLAAAPPSGWTGSAGGFRLVQLVAALPIARWPSLLGHGPDTLAGLPVESGYWVDVHHGWRRAAVRDHDPDWAAALLGASPRERPNRPSWPADEALVAVLPDAERVRRTVDALGGRRPDTDVRQLVLSCPRPWPAPLADAVVAEFVRGCTHDRSAVEHELLRAAGRALPLDARRDYLAALRELTGHAVPGWVPALTRCTNTMDLRRRFLRELS